MILNLIAEGRMKFARTLIVLFALQLARDAQGQITVSGTVVSDETGEALPGGTVAIEGTFIGTATDQDGAYSIDLRSLEDILIFSFLGFHTKRLTISPGVTTLDVRLEPSVVGLEGRRSRACTFSADMSKISRRSAAPSSRSRAGASTISNRKPPQASTSGYSMPGIGSPLAPRATSSIFRTGSSTSGRKRRPVPTTSSQ